MSLYEQDFYQWIEEQAALLKAGALSQLDVENLIEEVESMGKSQKKELYSRLIILISHLLKWDYQPDQRPKSWKSTILTQRKELKLLLMDNPSLRRLIPEAVNQIFEDSVDFAVDETGLPESAFPETCPYSIENIMGE
jgi:hypothetical protein